jgi:aminopeptidase Y
MTTRFLKTAALVGATAATASAFLQVPLMNLQETNGARISSGSRPLVNSEALQELINSDNLYKRAEDLYAVAQLSEPTEGHPTRVIGSAGALR